MTTAWNASAATGEKILADVLTMKQASITDLYKGPWILYVPTAYSTALDDDFKSNSDISVRSRLLDVEGIVDVKVSNALSGNNVILVQMTSDVVRLVEGLPITNVQWDTEGGMQVNFKVMSIQVPQIRADQTGRCGLVHFSV